MSERVTLCVPVSLHSLLVKKVTGAHSTELAILKKVKVACDFRKYREWQGGVRHNMDVFSCRCDEKRGNGNELETMFVKKAVEKKDSILHGALWEELCDFFHPEGSS